MIIDLDSVKTLFLHIEQLLNKDDDTYREKVYALYYGLCDSLAGKINKLVQEVQDLSVDEINKARKKLSGRKAKHLDREKELVLDDLTKIIEKIARYEALITCVINIAKKGCNGCQEHASLVSLALIKLFGVNKGPKVECIMLEGLEGTHGIVLVNRMGELDNVNSWGDGCLILDSWAKSISGIDTIPPDTALYSLKHLGRQSKISISVMYKLDMELNRLTRYKDKPDHLYHKIEKASLDALTSYFEFAVSNLLAKINLPELQLLPTPSSSPDSFFAATASAESSSTNDILAIRSLPSESGEKEEPALPDAFNTLAL